MRKIIVGIAVACALGAYAEERTVSTAADLVAALEALNSETAPAEPNVIYLQPGGYDVSSYSMANWDSKGKTSTSTRHIALANVTVSGTTDNPRDTVIYGDGTDGIAYCYAGNFRHLTISNGCETGTVSADRGGGVHNTGTGSVHSNVIVTCCQSGTIGGGASSGTWYDSTIISNSAANGGGIGFGTLYNCTIVSNSATKIGGGCYYQTVLHDCRVIGNRAKNGGGVGGGGGKSYYCHVFDGVIADNYSTATGGGAYRTDFYGGTVVSNNTSATSGGGVYMEVDNVLTNTVICCNSAKDGGGVSGKGVCSDCEIYGNTASGGGGGACFGSATNCLFMANKAARGGAVCSNDCVSCELVGNRATYGGGSSRSFTTNCVIAGNVATKYGGGTHYGTHWCNVITNNLAAESGGGAYDGVLYDDLVACNMVTGSASKVYGGGLNSATAYRCVISNNVVESFGTESSGGAYGAGAYNSTIYDSTVVFNANYGSTYVAYGGGMYGGCASNSLIIGNACYPADSAGKTIQGGGTHTSYLTNCVIRNNFTRSDTSPGVNGGSANGCLISNNVGSTAAAYAVRQVYGLQNCEVVGVANIRNGPVVNCRFVNFTNGYYLAQNENVIMDPNMRYHVNGPISRAATTSTSQELIYTGFVATNCLIANNRTSGGLFQASGSLKLILHNCTVANNVCAYTFLSATNGSQACAVNTIFVGNKTAKGTAHDMNFPSAEKSYVALTNCLIGSGRQAVAVPEWEVNTITNNNAGFVGGNGSGRYEPGPRSPVLGQGLVQDWMTDATDIRADAAFPRLRDGKVDIGCYQSWLDPTMLYVDPNCGDDALAGLSAASAKRTLDAACADVSNNGFTIVLLPGVHPSPSGDYSRKGSAPVYRVLFKSQQGPEQTIIDGNDERCLTGCMDAFTTIEGCTLQRFACANVNWQTFWALEFTNCVFSGDFRRATSDCRRLFQHCVFRNCRGDINLTYGADYDDSSGRYGNGTECFYGCVAFDSVFRITSSGNPHRFDGCSYFENCFIQLGAVTRLSDAIGAPHYNVLGNRQRFVDTTLVVGSATEWTAGGFFNCLLGFGDAGLPEPPNVNSCILTNANAVLAQLCDDLRPTEPTWRTYGYNRDQTDTDLALMNSLAQPNDPGLANVSGRSTYAAYSEWATSVKTSDGRKRAGVEAVAASPNAWMAFALSSPTLLNESLSEDDLCIKSFESAGAGDGASRLVLGVKDVAIGEDALPENLKKLFQVEGAATLSDGAFSTDNVSVEFDDPKGGDVAVLAKPKSASSAFFFRLKK